MRYHICVQMYDVQNKPWHAVHTNNNSYVNCNSMDVVWLLSLKNYPFIFSCIEVDVMEWNFLAVTDVDLVTIMCHYKLHSLSYFLF